LWREWHLRGEGVRMVNGAEEATGVQHVQLVGRQEPRRVPVEEVLVRAVHAARGEPGPALKQKAGKHGNIFSDRGTVPGLELSEHSFEELRREPPGVGVRPSDEQAEVPRGEECLREGVHVRQGVCAE